MDNIFPFLRIMFTNFFSIGIIASFNIFFINFQKLHNTHFSEWYNEQMILKGINIVFSLICNKPCTSTNQFYITMLPIGLSDK